MTTTSSSTIPVSVASSSSAGAAGGSVINVSSLVSQLVTATEAPQQALIATQTTANTTSISALGTLKSALATFQGSLSALSTTSAFNAETANSSDSTIFTATARSGAVGGAYSVSVSALASAQQLLSNGFIGGSSAAVGTGTLSLSLGGSSFNVTIDSTDDSVAGIAAAINSASGNPGISATVITGTDGAHLALSSSLTGLANTISVSASGSAGLSALAYGTGNTLNYKETAPASDASFSVAGVAYTSPSNSVTDALSGVTLNLLGTTKSGSSATLTVANDTKTVVANVQSFVTAYNTLEGSLASLGSYDATTGTAGPMMGSALLSGVQNQLKQALYSLVGTSNYNSLASIGITTQSDGTLAVNSATLQTALSTNFSAVSQLFSSTNGVASQLSKQISATLAAGSSIDSYSTTLVKQQTALTKESSDLATQMAALSASLTQQYSALNALLSSLQTISAQLSQGFAALPTVQGTPNA